MNTSSPTPAPVSSPTPGTRYLLLLLFGLIAGPGVIGQVHGQGSLVCGQTALGNLSTTGAVHTWTFSAAIGDSMIVRMGDLNGTANLDPWLRLYGPNGALLDQNFSSIAAEVSFRATNSGTFTVLVADGNTGQIGTGLYRLTLAKTGEAVSVSSGDEGGPLVNGATHTGSISYGDLDVWTINASAGENLIVRLGDLYGTNSFYPWVRLFSPNGVLLQTAYGAYAAEAVFRATNSGGFMVVVGDGNTGFVGIGPYRLTLAKTGSPVVVSPGDEGGPMTNGAMHLGEISVGDLDVWSFNANAGDNFVVRVGDVNGTGIFYPWVRLYGPNGLLLHHSYGPYAAEATFRATNSGVITVVIGDGNTSLVGTGPYRVTLAKTGDPVVVSAGDDGGPLTNGAIHTGQISYGDLDLWTVNANAGDQLIVRLGDFYGTNSFYPWVRLFSPNGVLQQSAYGAYAAEAVFRATNSGTFLVLVGDGNNGLFGIGPYRLTLAKTGSPITVSSNDEGGPMTNGVMHLGDISYGDLDVWDFTASAGDYLVVRLGDLQGTNSFYPWVRLFGPNGALLDDSYGQYASEAVFRATNSGTFKVVVGDGNNGLFGVGPYRLTLARSAAPIVVSPGDQGGPMTNGVMHLGDISYGDLDVWSFTATTGDNLVIRLGDVYGTNSFYPWVRLISPNGVLLSQDFAPQAAEAAFRATNSGTYTVLVADGNNGLFGIGPYRLTLARTGAPIVASADDESGFLNGDIREGTIPMGDVDLWKFTICAGERILVTVTESVSGSGFYPWIRLYGRDGVLLNSTFSPATARIDRLAPASGDYLLIIGDGNTALRGEGGYRLEAPGLLGGTGVRFCDPMLAGGKVANTGISGVPGSQYVVITATNIALPGPLWTPIYTNQFGMFGEFGFTNLVNLNQPEQYFRLLLP